MARYITGTEDVIPTPRSGRQQNVSTLSVFRAYHVSGDLYLPPDEDTVVDDYRNHLKLLRVGGVDPFEYSPLTYIRYSYGGSLQDTHNSSYSSSAFSKAYYDQIESQLLALSEAEDEEDTVEIGAIETARAVLGQLQRHQYAPPALSWHGGDAVVMLWSLGGTTYAITATDGEVGYVVRRDRKAVKSSDSIAVNAFRLQDLR